MMVKSGLYVDSGNIFRADCFINYRALYEFCSRGKLLLRANAYVVIDPTNVERSQGFITALRKFGFKVITKSLQRFIDGNVKANMDIELAVDMIVQSQNLDILILVSGDGDFVRLVNAIQNMGKKVIVISFSDRVSSNLVEAADEFIPLEEIENIFLDKPSKPKNGKPEVYNWHKGL